MSGIESIVVTKMISAIVVKNAVFNLRHKFARKSFGLCFAKSGKMVYYHNGKEYISDKNHALFIPKDATYTSKCTQAGEFPLINFYADEEFAPKEFISFEIDDISNYLGEFEKLERLSLIKPKNGHLSSLAAIYLILNRLCKNEIKKSDVKSYGIISPAIKYLESNFTCPTLTNTILAEKAMVSEVYFRKIFKEKYGISPKQYIQTLRISKAESLLRNEYLSVSSISEMCGFSSVYHFSRSFKKVTGYTPSEYSKAFGGSAT